jgi:hypothetical protein
MACSGLSLRVTKANFFHSNTQNSLEHYIVAIYWKTGNGIEWHSRMSSESHLISASQLQRVVTQRHHNKFFFRTLCSAASIFGLREVTFDVLRAMNMKITVFWNVTQFMLADMYRRVSESAASISWFWSIYCTRPKAVISLLFFCRTEDGSR